MPHPTGEYGTRPFLRWVQAQDRSIDVPGIPQNASGFVGIPLKKEHLRHQAINLSLLGSNGSLRLKEEVRLGLVTQMLGLPGIRVRQPLLTTVSRYMTHPTRSAPLTPRQCAPSIGLAQLGKTATANCYQLAEWITVNCTIFIGRVHYVPKLGWYLWICCVVFRAFFPHRFLPTFNILFFLLCLLFNLIF